MHHSVHPNQEDFKFNLEVADPRIQDTVIVFDEAFNFAVFLLGLSFCCRLKRFDNGLLENQRLDWNDPIMEVQIRPRKEWSTGKGTERNHLKAAQRSTPSSLVCGLDEQFLRSKESVPMRCLPHDGFTTALLSVLHFPAYASGFVAR